MSKYEPLWSWISENGTESFTLTYEEIENILGFPIDHAFLTFKKELSEYGYEVGKISLKLKNVSFNKLSKAQLTRLQAEKLLHYDDCIVNLANSVLRHWNMETVGKTLPVADTYLKKDFQNIVVLLMDGMGINILERNLKPEGFFRSHLAKTYYSVFPPTTVAATTSLDSGLQPIEHGWLGWDCYYPQVDKNVTVFFNVEQGTDRPAADYSVARRYCGYQSIVERLQEAGVQAYYSTPFVPPFPQTFEEELDRAAELCAQAGRKYIYVYCNEPDYNMHREGCFADSTRNLLEDLERKIEAWCEQLEDTLVIITADHGHIDSRNDTIAAYPKLMECLERMPSIEPRSLNLFVKEGMEKQFVKEFEKAFGDAFILYTKEEILKKELFGTGGAHPCVKGMLGDFLAVAVSELSVFNTFEETAMYKGVHAGLTKEEMEIPFIVIEKEKRS